MQEKEQEVSLLKHRILEYIAAEGMKPAEFYRRSGITRGVLSQPNGLSEDNLMKFFSCFPNASPDWIITGSGNKKRDFSPMQEKEQENLTSTTNAGAENAINQALQEEISKLKEEKLNLLELIVKLQGRIIG